MNMVLKCGHCGAVCVPLKDIGHCLTVIQAEKHNMLCTRDMANMNYSLPESSFSTTVQVIPQVFKDFLRSTCGSVFQILGRWLK